MTRSSDETPYYQFPLSLLQFAHEDNFDREGLARHIAAWTLINSGLSYWENHGAPLARRREKADKKADELTRQGRLSGYNPDDHRHRAAVLINAEKLHIHEFNLPGVVRVYERIKRLRDSYLNVLDDEKGDRKVRVRGDLLWNVLKEGKLSLRQFRVLAGIYGAIGSSDFYKISYNHIRHLSAGYKSEKAYQKIAENQELFGRSLDQTALDVPTPPSKFVRQDGCTTAEAQAVGLFPYDLARFYWKQQEADVPFTGPDGMFEATLTARGYCFRLRKEHFPPGESSPAFDHTENERACREVDRTWKEKEGDLVLFDAGIGFNVRAPELRLGRIAENSPFKTLIEADDGNEYRWDRCVRLLGRPVPLELCDEKIEEGIWTRQTDLLSYSQVRTTVSKLLDRRWLRKYRDGRHCYYSNSLSNEELAKRVERGKIEHKKRQLDEEKATLEAEKELSELNEKLEEVQQEIEALRSEE